MNFLTQFNKGLLKNGFSKTSSNVSSINRLGAAIICTALTFSTVSEAGTNHKYDSSKAISHDVRSLDTIDALAAKLKSRSHKIERDTLPDIANGLTGSFIMPRVKTVGFVYDKDFGINLPLEDKQLATSLYKKLIPDFFTKPLSERGSMVSNHKSRENESISYIYLKGNDFNDVDGFPLLSKNSKLFVTAHELAHAAFSHDEDSDFADTLNTNLMATADYMNLLEETRADVAAVLMVSQSAGLSYEGFKVLVEEVAEFRLDKLQDNFDTVHFSTGTLKDLAASLSEEHYNEIMSNDFELILEFTTKFSAYSVSDRSERIFAETDISLDKILIVAGEEKLRAFISDHLAGDSPTIHQWGMNRDLSNALDGAIIKHIEELVSKYDGEKDLEDYLNSSIENFAYSLNYTYTFINNLVEHQPEPLNHEYFVVEVLNDIRNDFKQPPISTIKSKYDYEP